jgi:hypothetical protein
MHLLARKLGCSAAEDLLELLKKHYPDEQVLFVAALSSLKLSRSAGRVSPRAAVRGFRRKNSVLRGTTRKLAFL